MTQKESKREKRLKRGLERKQHQAEKKARFASGIIGNNKAIRASWEPELSKEPIINHDMDNYLDTFFSWCVIHADLEGNWTWGESRQWSEEEYSNEISSLFNNLNNNTWREIENQTYNGSGGYRKKLNKHQSLESICDEAQDRLENTLDLRGFDVLFRFRRGTYKRIWGIRLQHHFFTIWYERNHRICPIEDD